jgi:uncharacterized HAD superfamily protein
VSNIVVDIDDTLMRVAHHLLEPLNALTGKTWTEHNLWSFALDTVYDTPAHDIQQIWLKDKSLERATWLGDQMAWLHAASRWIADGHNLIYCSARMWHPDAENLTVRQLESKGRHSYKLYLLAPGLSKTELLLNQGIKPDVFADDHYGHVVEASKAGAQSLLYSQPWNFQHIWGNRVNTQDELIAGIDTALAQVNGY